VLLLLLSPLLPTISWAQSAIDANFRSEYQRHYAALKDVAANVVVVELRDRVELIAGRGSQVGAASNDRRVSGFEQALLQELQGAVCRGPAQGEARPSAILIERINAAAATQHLRTRSSDVAELAAMAQHLVDSQSRERLCKLTSLDDVQ
jgi:hypothetical protein